MLNGPHRFKRNLIGTKRFGDTVKKLKVAPRETSHRERDQFLRLDWNPPFLRAAPSTRPQLTLFFSFDSV